MDGHDAIHIDDLDAWLKSALDIKLESCICLIPESMLTFKNRLTVDKAWRCLLMARSLLQAAGIPVFDAGVVVSIEQDHLNPAQSAVVVGLSQIEEIPEACYTLAFEAAVQVIKSCQNAVDIQLNGKRLLKEIEELALVPMKKMVVAGISTIPLLRCAFDMDIPFVHLGGGVYQLGWGCRAWRFDRSISDKDPFIGAKLAQHKAWSAGLLRMAGLPSPEQGVVVGEKEALETAHRIGLPAVVKPADLDRGEGVITGVNSEEDLRAAFAAAMERSHIKQVIVEKQAPGICHRILVAHGGIIYAAKRLPKGVIGDGRQTVAELIDTANQTELAKAPWLRSEPFPYDLLAAESMRRVGFSSDSVPAAGTPVPLRPVESTLWGGYEEDVTERLHPDNRALALRAAALFGLHVAGIDIISLDISEPWYKNGAIINEVNFAPVLGDGHVSAKYLPAFLSKFFDGGSRIPIDVFIGAGSAMASAKKRRHELAQSGIKCFLTSNDTTIDAFGVEIIYCFQSLFKRCRALLLNRQIEHLLLVVQTDEWLDTGLPVDGFANISCTDNALMSWTNPGQRLLKNRADRLVKLITH